MSLLIYGDNIVEALWFKELSPLLGDAVYVPIGRRGTNPPEIDDLISYDRPDIIITLQEKPLLVLEKTREVPTGHNVGQRVARLVRAAELNIPVICFFPFDAMKHGEYAGICNLNIRLLRAFERMFDIHKVPILAIPWPVDHYGELVDDGSENEQISKVVHGFLSSGCKISCKEFADQLNYMHSEYQQRLDRRNSYDRPPNSAVIERTVSLASLYGHLKNGSDLHRLTSRSETLVYKIGMTEQNCRREDPYTGTQFIYDYIWCRSGAEVHEKHRNLILYFPNISMRTWNSLNPNDNNRKSCNWYLTANAFIFRDAVHVLRD